jgi:protein ImuA
MYVRSAAEDLRQWINRLEETQRRFSRTVPIADLVDHWLPNGGLPAGCIHEVKGTSLAKAIAFSAILSARLAGDKGNILYLAPDRSLYPLGLLPYGVNINQVLHVSTKRHQDLSWAVIEALRCPQVSSVIALLDGLDLTESRRLQLAAEASGATGFLLGNAASAPIASPITRWKVSSVVGKFGKSGQRFDEPLWALDLLYCRGGRPGSWTLEWRNQKLQTIQAQPVKQAAREARAG